MVDEAAIVEGDIEGFVASEDAPIAGESWGTAVTAENIPERDLYRSVGNRNRPALIVLAISVALLLALIVATRGGAASGDVVLAGQTSESAPQSTDAGRAPEVTDPSTLDAIDPDEVSSTVTPVESSNEIAAVVQPADTIAVPRAGSAPTTTATVPGVLGEEQPPEGGTTTTTDGNQLGICVFEDGTIASPLRAAVCPGFFTLDNAEANRVSAQRKGTSTTTASPTTTAPSTTSSSTPEPTTTLPPTTTTTTTTTSTTTTTTSAPPTTVAPTTTHVTLPPTIAPPTTVATTTTEKKRRGKGKDGND